MLRRKTPMELVLELAPKMAKLENGEKRTFCNILAACYWKQTAIFV